MRPPTRLRLLKVAADLSKLKRDDWITVYHGTPLFRLPGLINGFDATQETRRDYRPGTHPGLFVTKDLKTAKGFGGGAVIEIRVRAKSVHGTDYGGNIGREQEKAGLDHDWIRKKHPESFRPYLTHTMEQSNEPQGLLRGIVKPSQILRVWVRRSGSSWDEFTREEFLKREEAFSQQYGRKEKFQDAGIDLSSPKLSLEEFVSAYREFHGRPGGSDKMIETMVTVGRKDPNRVKDLLLSMKFGGSSLGQLALNNLFKQVMSRVNR